jgi:hypothetical protein
MKGFATLVEIGLEQAAIDYVGGLFRNYMTPNEPKAEANFIAGLRHLQTSLERAEKIVAAHSTGDES